MLIVQDMAATAIVAVSASTRGIGFQGTIPWSLPSDMKHFANVTKYGSRGSSSSSSSTTTNILPTKRNVVIMGRKTWNSIPSSFRPLQGRTNVILTSQPTLLQQQINNSNNKICNKENDIMIATSLQDAWIQLGKRGEEKRKNKTEQQSEDTTGIHDEVGEIFIIGGSQLYQQAIEEKFVHKIIMTCIDTPSNMQFDTYFPDLFETTASAITTTDTMMKEWTLVEEKEFPIHKDGKENDKDKNIITDVEGSKEEKVEHVVDNGNNHHSNSDERLSYRIRTYIRSNGQEEQYLNLIRNIIQNGIVKNDRTGTGTKSIFGAQMRFDLRHGQFPLLTTKKTFWRGVAEELLWFISGSTNANLLQQKKINIWNGNASKEFLQSRGLGHREEGDLGPIYGFQWRHFGAQYKDMHTDYQGQGIDQLQQCIDKIKNNPDDRRILLTAWNPLALDEMALPPCHVMCQFFVDTTRNELSCQLYQRSADMGLGVPFNIASYALLTYLIAHVTGRKPGDLVHTLGDAHVYSNHIEPLQEQLERTPRPFPKLFIHDPHQSKTTIDDFTYDDLLLLGYHPHEAISMKMAV